MMWFRSTCIAAAFVLCALLVSAPASATLDTVIGQRSVVPDKPFSACSDQAHHALTSVMQTATEAGNGSGHWFGVDIVDGAPSEIAIVECHPQASGYAVSFTCSAQVPPSVDTAAALCTKVITAFNASATAATGGAAW
jgi:hypothetical protein